MSSSYDRSAKRTARVIAWLAIVGGGWTALTNGAAVMWFFFVARHEFAEQATALGAHVDAVSVLEEMFPVFLAGIAFAVIGGLFVVRGLQLMRLREAGRRGLCVACVSTIGLMATIGIWYLARAATASLYGPPPPIGSVALGVGAASVPFVVVLLKLRGSRVREVVRYREWRIQARRSGQLPVVG